MSASQLRHELRPHRFGLCVVLGYVVLSFAFTRLTAHGGLIDPSGALDPVVALCGATLLVLRLLTLLVVPPLALYRLLARLYA